MACCMCCWRLPQKEDKEPLVVDVIEVLSNAAWTAFKVPLSKIRRKCLKRSNFIIEVPENYFSFDQIGKPKYEMVDQMFGFSDLTDKAVSKSKQSVDCVDKPEMSANGEPAVAMTTLPVSGEGNGDGGEIKDAGGDNFPADSSISLDTTFNNDTAEKQTYQFKFSKMRTSRLEVTYQKGFTLAGKASFSLGLPKALGKGSVGLSAEKRLEIKQSRGQTFEESVTMEATSDVSVGPKSRYIAKVQMEERMVHAKFTVRVRMTMPQGRAPVYIRRRSDNALMFVYNIRNLEDIFFESKLDFPSVERVYECGSSSTTVEDKIDFLVEGVVKGNLACDHTINLTSDEPEDEKHRAKNKRFHDQD